MDKKVILLILDGWGIAKPDKFNAIDNANTPIFDMLKEKYPYMTLKADGENVGLPVGQMGTSEVNHLAIGSGRIVLQDLPKIDKSIQDHELDNNEELLELLKHTEDNDGKLHLVGLLSDGGIHSHINHLFALLDILKEKNYSKRILLHLFTDGRDAPPKSAEKYLTQLQEKLNTVGIGEIATVQGRVYLDRDRDWDRTESAYKLIANGEGERKNSWKEVITESYTKIDNDQYVERFIVGENTNFKEGDGILFFNFRTDRMFQIIKRTLETDIDNVRITAFCKPSESFDYTPIFKRNDIQNTLAETISENGRKQLHITETEKYAHVTYYFNGQRETEFPNEEWKLYDSNRYVKPLYNFEPSMRIFEFTKYITDGIQSNNYDFIIANYSNTDMVGHTGNYNAAVIAAESVDYCVGKIYEELEGKLDEYAILITADHGNSDEMWDYEADQPHTRHTLNPVPFIVVTDGVEKIEGKDLLSTIAPTILDLMGLKKPVDMQGDSLLG